MLFSLKSLLSCALTRTVSTQSKSVDGQRCGQPQPPTIHNHGINPLSLTNNSYQRKHYPKNPRKCQGYIPWILVTPSSLSHIENCIAEAKEKRKLSDAKLMKIVLLTSENTNYAHFIANDFIKCDVDLFD